jgi:hypothetical protein
MFFAPASITEMWGVLEYLDAHPEHFPTLRRQIICRIIEGLIEIKKGTKDEK